MFKCMREIAGTVETEEERKKMFGVFWNAPEKVRILPGHEINFKRFLAEVELKNSNEHPNQQRKKPISEHRKRPFNDLDVDDII